MRENLTRHAHDVDVAALGTAVAASRLETFASHLDGSYPATLLKTANAYYVEKKTMAFSSMALLGGVAYADLPQVRLLQTGSFQEDAAVDWSLKRGEGSRRVYDFFAALSNLAGGLDAAGGLRPDTSNGRRIALAQRRTKDGRRLVAVINLSHVGLANYAFGVDAASGYRVVLNGDAAAFGGSGVLEKRLGSGVLHADGPAMDGKDASLMLPYLGPYATVVLEQQ
jgi:hypothetical protein